jgi:hypothetical protein
LHRALAEAGARPWALHLQSGFGTLCKKRASPHGDGECEAKMRKVWHLIALLVVVVIAILWLRSFGA